MGVESTYFKFVVGSATTEEFSLRSNATAVVNRCQRVLTIPWNEVSAPHFCFVYHFDQNGTMNSGQLLWTFVSTRTLMYAQSQIERSE